MKMVFTDKTHREIGSRWEREEQNLVSGGDDDVGIAATSWSIANGEIVASEEANSKKSTTIIVVHFESVGIILNLMVEFMEMRNI